MRQQAINYSEKALQLTSATKDQILLATKKLPIPEKLKNISQKELAMAGIFFFSLLTLEEHYNFPIVTLAPQVISAICNALTATANAMGQKDPLLDNSIASYAMCASIGCFFYLKHQETKATTNAQPSNPPAETIENNKDEASSPEALKQ